MKNILFAGSLFLLLVGGFFLINPSEKDASRQQLEEQVVTEAEYEAFSDQTVGLAFEYRISPDGYILENLSSFIGEQQMDAEVVAVYRLMNAREKAELDASEGGREGPPSMSVMVIKNEGNKSASMWVDAFPMLSNTQLIIGAVNREMVVGGANAVRYRTDGLFQNQNVVVASSGYIYLFTGSFLEEDSDIYRDFNRLVESISFIPMTGQDAAGEKIDPRVACESALAYMTFVSGEDANAFVEACVRGEHPEVIERYIRDMGFDGSVI